MDQSIYGGELMSSFIARWGGNKETGGSGNAAIQRALASGMTLNQIRNQAQREGISWGSKAQDYLNTRSPNLYISQYGGDENTMADSGLAAVSRAMSAGMTPQQIEHRAASEGVSFGSKARAFLDAQGRPKQENSYLEDMRANNERIQAQFDQRMAALNQQMAAQQNVYAKSLETMQNTLKATMSPNIRESVLGVKGASTGGSDSQAQARQGLKGTFSRSGMRIKKIKDQSLNVA